MNVNLAPARAKEFMAAIRRNERLERLLERMRAVSVEIMELTTPGVARRKRIARKWSRWYSGVLSGCVSIAL